MGQQGGGGRGVPGCRGGTRGRGHPRRPRPEEQLASLPVEEGSSPTPLMGSHFVMSLDSSAPSAAVYQEWQDEYVCAGVPLGT